MLETAVSRLLSPEEAASIEFPELLQEALQIWQTLRGRQRFPSRDQLDPLVLRRLTTHIMLWEVREAPKGEDFVVVIAGERAVQNGGGRMRGKTLPNFHGDEYEEVWREFDAVRRTGNLHYCLRGAHWIRQPYLQFHRLLMPLGEGDTVTHLFSILDYDSAVSLTPMDSLMQI